MRGQAVWVYVVLAMFAGWCLVAAGGVAVAECNTMGCECDEEEGCECPAPSSCECGYDNCDCEDYGECEGAPGCEAAQCGCSPYCDCPDHCSLWDPGCGDSTDDCHESEFGGCDGALCGDPDESNCSDVCSEWCGDPPCGDELVCGCGAGCDCDPRCSTVPNRLCAYTEADVTGREPEDEDGVLTCRCVWNRQKCLCSTSCKGYDTLYCTSVEDDCGLEDCTAGEEHALCDCDGTLPNCTPDEWDCGCGYNSDDVGEYYCRREACGATDCAPLCIDGDEGKSPWCNGLEMSVPYAAPGGKEIYFNISSSKTVYGKVTRGWGWPPTPVAGVDVKWRLGDPDEPNKESYTDHNTSCARHSVCECGPDCGSQGSNGKTNCDTGTGGACTTVCSACNDCSGSPGSASCACGEQSCDACSVPPGTECSVCNNCSGSPGEEDCACAEQNCDASEGQGDDDHPYIKKWDDNKGTGDSVRPTNTETDVFGTTQTTVTSSDRGGDNWDVIAAVCWTTAHPDGYTHASKQLEAWRKLFIEYDEMCDECDETECDQECTLCGPLCWGHPGYWFCDCGIWGCDAREFCPDPDKGKSTCKCGRGECDVNDKYSASHSTVNESFDDGYVKFIPGQPCDACGTPCGGFGSTGCSCGQGGCDVMPHPDDRDCRYDEAIYPGEAHAYAHESARHADHGRHLLGVRALRRPAEDPCTTCGPLCPGDNEVGCDCGWLDCDGEDPYSFGRAIEVHALVAELPSIGV